MEETINTHSDIEAVCKFQLRGQFDTHRDPGIELRAYAGDTWNLAVQNKLRGSQLPSDDIPETMKRRRVAKAQHRLSASG